MERGPELRSGEVMMSSTLEEQLTLLLEKVDRILLLLETPPGLARQCVVGEDTGKKKPSPLSTDDITRHQELFEKLYGTWDAGEGLQVVTACRALAPSCGNGAIGTKRPSTGTGHGWSDLLRYRN